MTETNDNSDPTFPRSRVKKQSNRVLYLFIITIILLTGGFYFYQKNLKALQDISDAGMDSSSQAGEPRSVNKYRISSLTAERASLGTGLATTPSQQGAESSLDEYLPIAPATESTTLSPTSGDNTIIQGEIAGNNTVLLDPITKPSSQELSAIDYQGQITQLNTFYEHLDSQLYMQDFKLPEVSKTHFSKLIQKLIDNPPVVTRETDDLFTLLKNTAHFFRIIGKDNILVLKGILDREKESFESTLQSLFILTNKPDVLKDEYSVTLDQDALYDYACFFLNTMGGRLYLFRRDSNSRMAVSFYAIAIIDRANESGNSRHGIDIRPGIDSLIEEIENGGKNLRMREYYLDTLYDLKVKYD